MGEVTDSTITSTNPDIDVDEDEDTSLHEGFYQFNSRIILRHAGSDLDYSTRLQQ